MVGLDPQQPPNLVLVQSDAALPVEDFDLASVVRHVTNMDVINEQGMVNQDTEQAHGNQFVEVVVFPSLGECVSGHLSFLSLL